MNNNASTYIVCLKKSKTTQNYWNYDALNLDLKINHCKFDDDELEETKNK